jgi:transcriptional/translational regulatory protein YebC/TACO1
MKLTVIDRKEAKVLAKNIPPIELARRVVLLQRMLEDCNARLRTTLQQAEAMSISNGDYDIAKGC